MMFVTSSAIILFIDAERERKEIAINSYLQLVYLYDVILQLRYLYIHRNNNLKRNFIARCIGIQFIFFPPIAI
jgi:hypothetical protein